MKTFKVRIRDLQVYDMQVEADSEEEAQEIVESTGFKGECTYVNAACKWEIEGITEISETVTCKFCSKEVPADTAHLHQGQWVGDECCWDERLRSTE